MGLIVKICGLSTPETVEAAIDAGADMVGLNFFPRSPRFVATGAAQKLADRARGRADIVAVTVDMDDDALAGVVEEVRPDWLQLHGSESPERVDAVRAKFRTRVIKAVGIRDAADVASALAYAGVGDQLLLDARPPKGSDRPGGNAKAFDWRLIAGFDPGVPWLLSGGINPANVGEALVVSRAPGIDVSSGVERALGVKDPALIRAFIAAARHAAGAPVPEGIAT